MLDALGIMLGSLELTLLAVLLILWKVWSSVPVPPVWIQQTTAESTPRARVVSAERGDPSPGLRLSNEK